MYLVSLFWIGPQPELTPRKIIFRWTETGIKLKKYEVPLYVRVIVDDVVFVFLCLAHYHYHHLPLHTTINFNIHQQEQ